MAEKVLWGLAILLLICHVHHTAGLLNDRFMLLSQGILDKKNYQVSLDDPTNYYEIPLDLPPGFITDSTSVHTCIDNAVNLRFGGSASDKQDLAFDYNYDMNHAYVTSDIYRVGIALNLTGVPLWYLMTSTNASIKGIAYDPTSRLLYYTARAMHPADIAKGHYGFVGVFDMKGRELTLRYSPYIPRAIAVHPPKGLIFYMTEGSRRALYRMEMNGANLTLIFHLSASKLTALLIDYDDSLLYWCDYSSMIYSCDLDGRHRRTVYRDTRNLQLQDMVMIEGYLYYTSYYRQQIAKLKADNTSDFSFVGPSWRRLTSFDIYIAGVTDKIVPRHPECSVNNQNCSHFCLPTAVGHVCACETGYNLLSDLKHCENVPRCPVVMKTAVVNDTNSCLRVSGNVCEFDCLHGYRLKAPTFTNVICTNEPDMNDTNIILWNIEPCEEIVCPDSVDNGVLSGTCNTSYLNVCNYTCNRGYMPNKHLPVVTCVREGEWGKEGLLNAAICTEVVCPDSVDNGVLSGTCNTRYLNVCNYTCNRGYMPNKHLPVVTCVREGEWGKEGLLNAAICTEIVCPDSVDNGVLSGTCNTRYLNVCNYTCNRGYMPNKHLPVVTCVREGEWGKEGLLNAAICTEFLCPEITIANGEMDVACDRKVDSDCINYTCNTGFKKNMTSMICSVNGTWEIQGQFCVGCVHAAEPLKPTFGKCQPYVLEGIVEGGCQNCDGYYDITYDWMLREHICSEPTTILEGTNSTLEVICNSLNCDNLRNGMTSEILTLIVTVTAQHDLPNSQPVKSSLYTEVFVRKLPVEEEELHCTISPKVGGRAVETKYHINCTALHVKFDLYSGNNTDFYKNHNIQLKKKIFVEFESKALLIVEFVEPVSQSFALPPGDPVILKVKVFNCDTLVLSQTIQLEVLDYSLDILSIPQWRTYVADDISVIYGIAIVMRNSQETRPNGSDYVDLKMEMLSELADLNKTSLQKVTTTTTVLNMITENVDWLHNISGKTSVVDLYSKLAGYLGEYMGAVHQEESIYMSGVVLKGVSSLLDYFVDEKGSKNESEVYSGQMLNMSKQLMVSIEKAGDLALRNLPQTDSPVSLYTSESTALLVQKQSSFGISGTTLLIESDDSDVSDTSFKFPDSMGFVKDSEIYIQMIYQEKNPFMWKNTSVSVTSPVLTITIKDEDGNELEIDNLLDPVKYITPRKSNMFDIGQINVTYMRINESFSLTNTSEMLMVSVTIHESETKILEILLPENISDIWVYGQPLQPPDYLTVLRKGFNYPRDWKAMQVFYGKATDPDSLPNKISDFKIYITADDFFFSVNRSYEMYYGITINFNDMMNQLEELDTKCKNIVGECFGDLQLSFSIQLDSLYCLFWNERLLDWSTDGCEVLQVSNVKQLECGCNHLSSFSVSHISHDFLVEPVLVNLGHTILFLTFFDNPVVVTAVVAVWFIYFSLVYWAHRLDKKDMEQIGVLHCDDNCLSEEYLYVICVMTGWWNQAGTTANVFMNISGLKGSTSKKRLSTSARQCFQSGFEDWFVLTTEKGLGSLESVTVWHDNSGKSPHWYLTQVYVKDLQTGASWNFIYNDWLAVDRGDFRHTSVTIPATTNEDMKVKQKYNFFFNSSRYLRESHLWISIFSKTPRSSFSRVQRLTCGLSLLLTMMLTNIMFYGLPSDDPEDQIQAGSFSFSLKQFIIGIESSIIMFPVNFIIIQLFIRVKPKPGKVKKFTIDSARKRQLGHSLKDWLSEFYIKFYRSKRFVKSNLYREIYSMFPADERNKNGQIIVGKYLETCTKNMFWKSLKESEREDSPYNLTKGLYQEEFFGKLKQLRTMSLVQPSSKQSRLIWVTDKLSSSSSLGDALIEIRITMSNIYTQWIKRNSSSTFSSAASLSSSQTTELKPVFNRKGVKKVFPWWFINISWVIVMLTCLVSSFFIMLYGLKYGYIRSTEFMVSFLTGFFQSICVEQPLKVIGIAVILTLILRRPAEIAEYGPDIELDSDEEYVSKIKTKDYKHQPFVESIPDSLLRRIKKRLRLKWLMDKKIQDMVLHILYLTVLLIIVNGHSNNYISHQNSQTIYSSMVIPRNSPKLLEVTTPQDFYSYMLETFVPVAEQLSGAHTGVISPISNHYLLGFFRLRQVRVKSGECETVLPHNFVVHCVDDYWIGSEDTESYAGNWSKIATNNLGTGPWTYKNSWDLKTLPFAGIFATYPGRGYVQIMKNNAAGKIQELDKKGWIDERTRAVFVECTVYNPNVDDFTSVILLFEMTSLGHMYPKHEILSANLHHYTSNFQKVVAACEILFVCFNVFFIYIEYEKWKRNGSKRYLSETWTYVELLLILLFFVTIGLFIKRFITVSNTLKDYAETHKTKYINFSEAFLWNSILEYVMAFLVAIAIIKAIKLVNFMEKMKLVTETLAKIRPELFGYLFLLLILIIAYSHCGWLFFGKVIRFYRNVQRSFYSNTLIPFDTEIGQELKNTSPNFGPIFIVSFVMAVNYISVQLWVAILNTGRIITKFELSKKDKNEFISYIATKIRMITTGK